MTKATKQTKTTKAPTIKLLEGSKAIEAAIKSIATRGKGLERDIHTAAVSCLVHADKHGDITLAVRLIEAIPSLARKNALRDWFIAFGKFEYNMAERKMTFNRTATTHLEKATAAPFWEFKAEAEYKPFNLQAAVLQLVKRAEKAKEHGDEVSDDQLNLLRGLVA